MNPEFENLSVASLLKLHCDILDELKVRNVLRTANGPTGDYAEWLVAQKLGLTLSGNSQSGYDATDPNDKNARYQIKGRRVTLAKPSLQLSAIRGLNEKKFDYLVAVIFNSDFTVQRVVKAPHEAIIEHAKYSKHTNAHNIHCKEAILKKDNRWVDITYEFVSN
jgi:hypothetical protein